MPRGEHRLQIKHGPRTVIDITTSVDPKDHKDLSDAVKSALKSHHQDHLGTVRVLVYTKGRFVKEVEVG